MDWIHEARRSFFRAVRSGKDEAERLFIALKGGAGGSVPSDYRVAHILHATGWTWREYMETPADVVRKVMTLKAVINTIQTKGNLQFDETGLDSEDHSPEDWIT